MVSPPDRSPGLRALLVAACLVVVVAGLRIAAPLLVPLAVALFIAVVSLPALRFFRSRGVPGWLAILLLVLINAVVLSFFGWILLRSAAEMGDALPAYAVRFHELEQSALEVLRGWGVEIVAIPYASLLQPERIFGVTTTVLRGVTSAVSTTFLVLLLLVFILSEAAGFPAKLRAAFGTRAGDLTRFAPILHEVQQYLALKTLISLVTGLLIGTAAMLLGVDFALLWGLLAFLLNFIPNIGSIIAAIPAVAVALLQLGAGPALLLAAAYLAVNMVLGNLVEPALMGRRLGLSTLVVLLSLIFWGWAWGALGMILSLPLTMAAKIALENSRYRWIAVLLGSNPTTSIGLEPEVRPVGQVSEPPPHPSLTAGGEG